MHHTQQVFYDVKRTAKNEYRMWSDYYHELNQELRSIDGFVKVHSDSEGTVEFLGAEFSDFGPKLRVEILAIAREHNAHPYVMAMAIVVIPDLMNGLLERMGSAPKEQQLELFKQWQEAGAKLDEERMRLKSWKYKP